MSSAVLDHQAELRVKISELRRAGGHNVPLLRLTL